MAASGEQATSKKQWRVLRRSVADFETARRSEPQSDRSAFDGAGGGGSSTVRWPKKRPRCVGGRRASKQRYRALNPMGEADGALMAAVNRGEFAINGFRNRDVRARLYAPTSDKRQERQQMTAVGRKLRLLRGHGLIAKVSKTHRYVVTEKGRRIMTALLAARQASTEKLTAMAA